MGKVSLSNKIQEQQPTPKKNLFLNLTKKEWIVLSSYSITLITLGFVIGLVLFYNPKVTDPLDQLQSELNNKLTQSSKQLDKIQDEDLYKVVMEKKGKKIEQLKEQIESINQFKLKLSNEVQSFILNKKDELKQKEILYHR